MRTLTGFILGVGRVLKETAAAVGEGSKEHMRSTSLDAEAMWRHTPDIMGGGGSTTSSRNSQDGRRSVESRQSWDPLYRVIFPIVCLHAGIGDMICQGHRRQLYRSGKETEAWKRPSRTDDIYTHGTSFIHSHHLHSRSPRLPLHLHLQAQGASCLPVKCTSSSSRVVLWTS